MVHAMAETISGPAIGQKLPSTRTPVVERFLDLLRARDVDGAMDLLAADVQYENAGLPTIHGRERVRRLFRATVGRAGFGFEVYLHAISAEGLTVLTERTDVLKFRRLHIQFWVVGRFDVRDGRITLWRDYAGHLTFIAATVRGVIGTLVPAARAKRPGSLSWQRDGVEPST
jgi:limonene-1,2-epoxide hydrolase